MIANSGHKDESGQTEEPRLHHLMSLPPLPPLPQLIKARQAETPLLPAAPPSGGWVALHSVPPASAVRHLHVVGLCLFGDVADAVVEERQAVLLALLRALLVNAVGALQLGRGRRK